MVQIGRRPTRLLLPVLGALALATTAAPAHAAAPANDDFSNAEVLAVPAGDAVVTRSGSIAEATVQAGEPGPRGATPSVWYRVTPASDEVLEVDTCANTDFDTVLGVYTGTDPVALTTIGEVDDSCNVGTRVSFAARAGTTYSILVGGYNGVTGTYELALRRSSLLEPQPYGFFGNAVNPTRDRVRFGIDGTFGAQLTCVLDGGASAACPDPIDFTSASLAEGEHTLAVTASFAGQTSTPGSTGFAIDTTPPTVTLTGGPAAGASVPNGTASEYTVGEPAALLCGYDLAPVDFCNSGGPGPLTAPMPPLCAGQHVLKATARDQAGNESSVPDRTVTITDGEACAAPEIVGGGLDGVDATVAYLQATTNTHGSGGVISAEYGLTTAYGETTEERRANFNGSAGISIPGLEPATEYHARLVVRTPSGTTRSADIPFTTDPASGPVPSLGAVRVTDITTTGATLAADAESLPNGEGNARFEYGTTTAYGTRTPLTYIENGETLSEALTGLQPGTTYHYRVVTFGYDNVGRSADGTFTTSTNPAPPVSPTPAPPAPAPPVVTPPVTKPSTAAAAAVALRSLLRPAGLTLRSLRTKKSVVSTFAFPAPGKVSVTWKAPSKGTTGKAITVATGSRTVKAAGKAKVTITFTKKGRSLFKRRNAVKLTQSATYRATGEAFSTSAKRTTTLKAAKKKKRK